MDILEVGGGLSGLQFVLAREGNRVTNVDPGLEAEGVGFELDAEFHARLARCLNAPVQLVSATVDQAQLPRHSLDLILSISALEHFSDSDVALLGDEVGRILKPQGLLLLTADLFLDVEPFCRRSRNRFGKNLDLNAFLSRAGCSLEYGEPKELHGFPDFDPDRILANLGEYLLGARYPALVQCVVARRRASSKGSGDR